MLSACFITQHPSLSLKEEKQLVRKTTIIIFLLLSFLVTVGQENLIIDKVRFEGNDNFAASRLKEQMIMESYSWFRIKILGKEPVVYSQSLYQSDIKRIRNYYQKNGYLNVEFLPPELAVNKKDRVEVTIRIRENKPITISGISFLVDSAYTAEDVLKKRDIRKIELQTGTTEERIFRDEDVKQDRLVIAEIFYDKGYPYTQVEPHLDIDTATNTTSLNWTINRGPLSYFGQTAVTGNRRVPARSILRQRAYESGEIWSKNKIDQTQEHIYNQGNYRVASVRTQLTPEKKDTIPVRIQITEAPRWSTRFGVGYGREDKFRAFAELQYLSFLTNTGRLNVFAKHSGLEPYNFYLKFSQPSFLFPFNTFTVHPFMLRQNEPGYKLDKWGINLTFLQNFSEELSTSIGYIFEDVQLDTLNINESELTPSNQSFYRKSGLILGAIYNNSEPILDPVQGYIVSVNLKTNDLWREREIPFLRFITEFKTYLGLTRGVTLALKAKMGGIARSDNNDFIPVEERFFAGGSYSVRGWSRGYLGPKDENGIPIGGKSLLEGSAEFRFDVGRRFKLSLFTDAGNVWQNPFSYHLNDLHYAAGFGVHIKTPIGPAGIDFARPVFDSEDKWQVHFNIGHTF